MSVLTLYLRLVLRLLNADIKDREDFVVWALIVVDDGQSGRLGGYEDSSLAPNDWHRLAQRIFVLGRRGQALSVNHLPTNQTAEIQKMRFNVTFFFSYLQTPFSLPQRHLLRGNELTHENRPEQEIKHKDNKKYLWT